jgi:hypothetical protein
MGSQFGQAQASGVQAGLARATVVVVVGDVLESCSFESCVIHGWNVQPESCGLPVYKSYSVERVRTLYGEQPCGDAEVPKIRADVGKL